jgi:hypothetical protein
MSKALGNTLAAWAVWRAWRSRRRAPWVPAESVWSLHEESNAVRIKMLHNALTRMGVSDPKAWVR